ncbi:MAG: GyrI-like domain-containing protein [Pikeienuella sp.]
MTVETRDLPERRAAALRHIGPYPEIGAVFGRLLGVIEAQGLWPQIHGMAGIFHDDPNSVAPADLRSHAAAFIAEEAVVPEGLEPVHLPAGRYAVLTHIGSYTGLSESWAKLYEDVVAAGLCPGAGPAVELYLTNPSEVAEAALRTELQLPLA